MGGSCGGNGDMGELDRWLAWSEKRGDEKYSVGCDGDGSGCAAGLATGSGDARLEALRFAWPGLRYENMLEGAMVGCGAQWARGRDALLLWSCREDDYQPVLAVERVEPPLSEAMHQKTPLQDRVRPVGARSGLPDADWEKVTLRFRCCTTSGRPRGRVAMEQWASYSQLQCVLQQRGRLVGALSGDICVVMMTAVASTVVKMRAAAGALSSASFHALAGFSPRPSYADAHLQRLCDSTSATLALASPAQCVSPCGMIQHFFNAVIISTSSGVELWGRGWIDNTEDPVTLRRG
tara:strand:- start:34523 stop:35401 length:879 start_codon:yes stop_codon:yes gene_type:complete